MADTLVTDAMVEKAARAQWDVLRDRARDYQLDSFEQLEPERQADWLAETRAGLEAVVGDIVEAFGASGHGRRVVTTPHDDPIVQACIENGGHFWPEDGPEDEPRTCTRCWFNPGWVAGKPRDERSVRPITDDPRGG